MWDTFFIHEKFRVAKNFQFLQYFKCQCRGGAGGQVQKAWENSFRRHNFINFFREVMSLEVTPSEVTSLLSENFREYLLSSENSFRINLLKLSPQKLCPHAANSILKVESYIAET